MEKIVFLCIFACFPGKLLTQVMITLSLVAAGLTAPWRKQRLQTSPLEMSFLCFFGHGSVILMVQKSTCHLNINPRIDTSYLVHVGMQGPVYPNRSNYQVVGFKHG